MKKTDPNCRCRGHGCVLCLAAHPVGKTCNDCFFIRHCKAFLSISGDETHCDWIPSRFTPPQGAG